VFGGAVLFGLLAVVALIAAHASPDRERAALMSYYFEARIESGQEDDVLDTLRGWYHAPDRWRFEFGDSNPERALAGGAYVSDGENVWFYSSETNTYSRQSTADYYANYPPELRGAPLFPSLSILIGPLPGGRDAFLSDSGTYGWTVLERSEGGVIAGRETEFVRLGVQGGEMHLWLDRQYSFVLRYVVPGGGSMADRLTVEVAGVSFDQHVDEGRLVFAAPEGSREVALSSGGSSSGSGSAGPHSSDIQAPAGFLTPGYVPGSYVTQMTESSYAGAGDIATRHLARLEAGEDGYLEIEQQFRAGGLAESQRTGDSVSIGGVQGYDQSAGGVTRLVWANGDVVVRLSSDSLPFDELTRIAESMR
jgi:outer membrane lipoprotein-sorting protein